MHIPVQADQQAGPLLNVRQIELSIGSSTSARPVRGISFELHAGERLAIVGESGSGKSLTALTIMGLLPRGVRVSGGEVLFRGEDLTTFDDRKMSTIRGRHISMIYQNPLSSLNPVRTVGQQIVETIALHEAISAGVARTRAIEILKEVGVHDAERRVDSYPHEFSGGMRQRVMIAMALSTNPEILLADEPTTALDVTTQARIIDLLLRLVEERQTAVILITHDLAVASQVATTIRVMYAGRIVDAASAETFFARPVHPYSEALLEAACRLDTDLGRALPSIGGQPPSPFRVPAGCAFHPRCPDVLDRCRVEVPLPIVVGGNSDHLVECHRASERAASSAGAGEAR